MAVMCLYGQPGSGKTVNATRLPGKSLLLSSDNSALVLKNFDRPQLTIKEVKNFKEFVEAFEAAKDGTVYDNIIVDCLTDLIDAYIVDIREAGVQGDIRQHYLTVYTKVKAIVREAAFSEKNCVFTCWEEVEEFLLPNGEIVNRVTPMLPDKIKQHVCGYCNIVAYVTSAVDKQGVRQWFYITEGKPTMMAKDQLFMRKSCLPENAFIAPEQ